MNMGLFYTGKGDAGTSEIGKVKVSKDSPIIETLGDLDELGSLIGVTRSSLLNKDGQLAGKLKRIQEVLFIIQARVAWIMFPEHPAKEVALEHIHQLEREIDIVEERIQSERGFIIPGEEPVAARLDHIRAVARRVERKIDTLNRYYPMPPEILAYMNRLSSYFFALARFEIFKEQIKESRPTYE